MELNILLAGVGGQGILTVAQAISQVALRRGLHIKQSEVHGMSQRGGAVQSHLRLADHPIHSDLIPLGKADLLIAVEPTEALRYTEYMNPRGVVVSNTVPFVNIPNYPPIENVLDRIAHLGDHVLIDATRLAKAAGSARSANMIMLGAAVRFLDFPLPEFETLAAEAFAAKGERVVEINQRALRIGYRTAGMYRDAMQRGHDSRGVRKWIDSLPSDRFAEMAAPQDPGVNPEIIPFEIPAESLEKMGAVLTAARANGRTQLFEHEVYQLVALAGGITPPGHLFIPNGTAVSDADLMGFPGERVVLKIVSPEIVHKSDVGGVAFVPKSAEEVQREIDQLIRRHSRKAWRVDGVLLVEFVEQAARGLGGELFVGIRRTRAFGPVIAAGLGGVDTEFLASSMLPGRAVAKASAMDSSAEEFFRMFQETAAYDILAGRARGHECVVGDGDLLRCFRAFVAIARRFSAVDTDGVCIDELEVNPFAFRRQQLVPLDGRGRLGKPIEISRPRPLENVTRLLEPRSIAVVGVSGERVNFGRIILRNIQECGFPQDSLYVVKKNAKQIDGAPCVPSLDHLPERVDLVVAATSAEGVPDLVEQAISPGSANGRCASVILIPGGLGEKEGTQDVQEEIRTTIRTARVEKTNAPVFLGGNCMGVRSRPGRYDTFFIPEAKMDPRRHVPAKRVALVSQSGAFIISRLSNLEYLDPQFAISVGNQVDLTVSDMLQVLATRQDVDCIGVYVEGFNDLDGLAFLRAVERATASGKVVVFYKAGRSGAGRQAARGHTSSVAGDYDVCQAAVGAAGAIVTDTFKEFEQLLELATDLHSKAVGGKRIAAISNAGYEAVGMADTLRGARYQVSMAALADSTVEELRLVLAEHQLDALVNPNNPLDLTPMATDAAYEACVRLLQMDENVDAVVVGCVPMTPRLLTTAHEIGRPGSISERIPRLFAESTKPLVFVVDCADPYDQLARKVRVAGVPVFRTADQAVRSLGRYLSHRAEQRPVLPGQVPMTVWDADVERDISVASG
jgi:indolepyruvate ferredoxin oxidoreductase beta subunit